MTKKGSLKLFEDKKIRAIWDEEREKWYFSIVDVIAVLVDSVDYQTARKYWNKLKQRLKEEGNETVTNCHQLKMRIGISIYLKVMISCLKLQGMNFQDTGLAT